VRALTPSQKGAAAEAAIAACAIELGLVVLRPVGEGSRYDLVIDLEPELLRVQCKWANKLDGVLSINLSTNRLTPSGYVQTVYTPEQVDAIAAYSAELGRCFLVPITAVSEAWGIHLRFAPARNNQAQRVRWAEDYDFAKVLAAWRRG
jgi:hypothetical protein